MIGWYAHHQGLGHLQRARCTLAALDPAVRAGGLALLTSHPAAAHLLVDPVLGHDLDVVPLPLDTGAPRSDACAAAPTPPGLHFAPLGVEGQRDRTARMAAWAAATDPDLVVVDVSVEVALLMRLLSVPTAVVRQHGRRDDPAHLAAYAAASVLLAPYPAWLEEPGLPAWVRDRTVHAGGFSRFDDRIGTLDRDVARAVVGLPAVGRVVVVLDGTGGDDVWPVGAAAAETPGWHWVVLGRGPGARFVDDPFPWLCAADVVVTHAGHNAVMEVAAARRPAVVIPQDRPHDEQRHKAARLAAAGAGLVRPAWPDAGVWPDLLEAAVAAGAAGAEALVDGGGAARAARAIAEAARAHRGAVQPA